ncbi:helix-turn-helix transcriptional regulator [Serratia rhizosphaerae]|uniref:AlpA family phage regulatory protein n=1 Tax=Serratia rhizosphaerae TaxID=2597702 RepID=A0ABX6GHI4_9GAMM|nr:AlpA family phage regulatory protein [Serratia rhizosphaerae]QHA85710.1 AlpA family phage regulatory protein [Serratia rhizosphaerae]
MKMLSIVEEKDFAYIPNIDRMIRDKECRRLTTLANSSRWKLEKDGEFPRRVKLGPRSAGWRLSEVQAWIRGEWYPGWKASPPELYP